MTSQNLLRVLVFATFVTIVRTVPAQSVAYESFTGIPTGSGLIGSGTDATGWLDSGWSGGSDARFQVVDPTPHLTFQVNGGALIDGTNRAVQLTTNPEPVPGNGLVASRSIPPQNTTLYASFLVRPMVIGTGSDTLGVQFLQGNTLLGAWVLQPDQGQQYFKLAFISSGGGGFSTFNTNIYAGQTYLIAIRVRRPSDNEFDSDLWINPPATFSSAVSSGTANVFFQPSVVVNSIGLGISSIDSGGPTSTAIFDELRIGYTWNDVVLQGPPQLGNISTRLSVGTGANVLIGGSIITGTQPKRVILRAIGPSLTQAGVPGALNDPTLELHDSTGTLIASNDNWQTTQIGGIITTSQVSDIQNSGLAPSQGAESAIIALLQPGGYTAIVRGKNDTTGVALVEGYDLDRTVDSKLANISTRGFVGTGDNVMIGGTIITGSSTTNVLIRAIGPSLMNAGVPNALQDTTLELHDGSGALIASNDNWRSDQEAEILATNLAPTDDRESAILRTLPPGGYTAIVRGSGNSTGVALVEAYQLDN